MDNGGGNPPASDQNTITAEAYQANLKRIQEVKEMVRRLEVNNEAAHKNFLVDELEKRAKDGREAEDMLARLRIQRGLSETVHFTNNVPRDKSEVILPTTATLVEVPESYSSPSYSSPAPTSTSHPPQTVQQGRPAKYQRSFPPQVQPYNPDAFRYYIPPPQHNAAPHTQAPVDQGQPGWYTPQNQPPQSRVHNPPAQTGIRPRQVQQPSHSWNIYPPQVALPAADAVSGYHTSPAGWIRTAPVHGGPSTGPSNPMYREPDFQRQSTASRPSITSHNQPLNFTSRVQVPLQGVPAVKPPFGQSPHIGSHLKSVESQSRPVSTAVPKPVATPELRRPHKPPQQLQQHEQQFQPQLRPQPQLQLQQQQPQRLPQPPLQSQQHPQQSQVQLLSQRPPQPPQTHQQAPPPPADRAPSASVPQPHSQPSQPPGPTIVDQATFIKLFQSAVQGGTLHLKAFWFYAKASGITDEWFKIAINSLPRNVWQSVMAQANQSRPILDAPPPADTPQQQVTNPGPNVPVVSAPSPLTATPLVQIAPATQQATKPSISTEESITHSASRQTSQLYATQLQYYAEQATKAALSAQVASISKSPPGNIAPTQTLLATPQRDVPQVQATVKTPKDANKSTLAKDILRALGKIVENPRQETGGEPADKINDHEGNQLPDVTPSQPISRLASAKPPAVPLAISSVDANSLSIPSAKPNVQDEPQCAAPPCQSIAKSVLKEEHGRAAVIEGPIMIDLTSEDSDESIDGKGQEPTFPMQSSASAAVSSQPVSPTNTTNHTPLFANLSLEEPPVDVAGASDNAVRMYSPPLPLPAEENTESELLYGNAELVLPNFEPLPSEPNEHPLDGQLPLFLPSPPVSPAPTEPPATELEMTNDEGESRPSLKRRSVEVDKMEIDTEMATPPRVRKRRKQQVYVFIPPAPLYVKKAKMKERAMAEGIESELEGVGQDEELQYSHLEQLLIEESKLRLLERRCRWLNCGAVLNCGANLLAHLKNHAREEASQAPFLCRWASCQRQFSMEQERDVHLERHTIRPLPCPFAGCNKQFDKPVEVMQHEVQHQKADRRELLIHKPTCQPIVPGIPARLGPPPQWLPSHRVIPRRVAKCQISADRHATVGPWVLWNIFSPVDINMRKQNASMRGRPTRQANNYDIDSSDPRRDDYDFLLALSSYPAKNPQLDDLDSALITMSAARGLTLWGSGATVNSTAGSATPEEYTNALAAVVDATVPSSATDETKVEGKANGNEVAAATRGNSITPEEGQSGQSVVVGEEDAVERMLIL